MMLVAISFITELRSQERTMLSFLFHKEKWVRSVGSGRDPSTKPILFFDSRAMVTVRLQEPKLSPFRGVETRLWLGWSPWWRKRGSWGSKTGTAVGGLTTTGEAKKNTGKEKKKKLDAEGRVANWYHIRSEKQKSIGKKEKCIDWKTDEKTLQKEFKYF